MAFVKGTTGVCLLLLTTLKISFASTVADSNGTGTLNNTMNESYLFHALEESLIKQTESLYHNRTFS